ncbi:YktB family protein [Virgibacillus sp. DJP39]|uniref:YktB family protein n=1 Tax=Virgibacillus sp. DJP39 TaxID=3409790 RepID=UPI003BB7E28C
MDFKGFKKNDFQTFTIDGLDSRMEAIRERIQPKFQAVGEEIKTDLSNTLGYDMYVHIAQHARRTVNPPKDTWMAFCNNKRGYKQHPHFQIGLFDDHLFLWLAYIYEVPNKKEIAEIFLDHTDDIRKSIPGDYMVSLDHTKKSATELGSINLTESLERFQNVKKAEFLIGRHFAPDNPLLRDGKTFLNEVKNTFETLSPLYKLSMRDSQ